MKNIYIFGDSLVYGQGDSLSGGWVSRLQKKLGGDYKLKNLGIPGDTSDDLLKRIEKQINNSNPNLIIISIGANDSQYKKDEKETLINIKKFKENLNKILNITQKYSQKIIFVGIPNMNDSITTNWEYLYHFSNKTIILFNKEIKKICDLNNLQYVNIFNTVTAEDLMDGAHPNSNGYQKIMEEVYRSIDFKNILL